VRAPSLKPDAAFDPKLDVTNRALVRSARGKFFPRPPGDP
jgi:hypothetical protein